MSVLDGYDSDEEFSFNPCGRREYSDRHLEDNDWNSARSNNIAKKLYFSCVTLPFEK